MADETKTQSLGLYMESNAHYHMFVLYTTTLLHEFMFYVCF